MFSPIWYSRWWFWTLVCLMMTALLTSLIGRLRRERTETIVSLACAPSSIERTRLTTLQKARVLNIDKGCEPARVSGSKFLFGLDMLLLALVHVRKGSICQLFCDLARRHGHTYEQRLCKCHDTQSLVTWLNRMFSKVGSRGFTTADPANIEALLSTQFQGQPNTQASIAIISVRIVHTDFLNIGLMPNTLKSIPNAGIIGCGAARPTASPGASQTGPCRYRPTHQCISRLPR